MVREYKLRIGSRAQVMHGTAKMTGGGLTKRQLKYNKNGKIVSRKASRVAKKANRLVKAGYVTRKGVFGVVRRGGANAAAAAAEEAEQIKTNSGKFVNGLPIMYSFYTITKLLGYLTRSTKGKRVVLRINYTGDNYIIVDEFKRKCRGRSNCKSAKVKKKSEFDTKFSFDTIFAFLKKCNKINSDLDENIRIIVQNDYSKKLDYKIYNSREAAKVAANDFKIRQDARQYEQDARQYEQEEQNIIDFKERIEIEV